MTIFKFICLFIHTVGTHMYMDFFKVSLYMNYFFFVKCRSTFLFTCCRVAHGIDTVYLTSPLWMDMDICISIRVDLQATNRIRTRSVELLMLLGSFSFVLSPHQRSGSRVWVRELFTFLQTNKTVVFSYYSLQPQDSDMIWQVITDQ